MCRPRIVDFPYSTLASVYIVKPADSAVSFCVSLFRWHGVVAYGPGLRVELSTMSVVVVVVFLRVVTVCSHRAQATLGVLYAQPPLTQDANVATDGTMVMGIVETAPEGKKVEESIQGLPSPGGSATVSVDVSLNDANVAMSVEAPGVDSLGGETLLGPRPVVVSIDDQQLPQPQLEDMTGDLPDVPELPEVRIYV